MQLVAAEDGVSEEINTDALINNFRGLQEWTRDNRIELPHIPTLAASFVALDMEYQSKLSGSESKMARNKWARGEA